MASFALWHQNERQHGYDADQDYSTPEIHIARRVINQGPVDSLPVGKAIKKPHVDSGGLEHNSGCWCGHSSISGGALLTPGDMKSHDSEFCGFSVPSGGCDRLPIPLSPVPHVISPNIAIQHRVIHQIHGPVCDIDFFGCVPTVPDLGYDGTPHAISNNTRSVYGNNYPYTSKEPGHLFKQVVASPGVIGASQRRRRPNNFNRLYKCTESLNCTATFTTSHNLRNHVDSHRGIRRHQCPFCSKKAVTKSDIKRHMKTCKKRKCSGGAPGPS